MGCGSLRPQGQNAIDNLPDFLVDGYESPPADSIQGFASVLPQHKTFSELWAQLQTIRTYPEQVRSYLADLNNGASSGEYGDLPQAAEEEWPVLKKALTSNDILKKVILLDRFVDACPRCYIGLPTGEIGKLQSVGIATTKNCCRRILIWPGA